MLCSPLAPSTSSGSLTAWLCKRFRILLPLKAGPPLLCSIRSGAGMLALPQQVCLFSLNLWWEMSSLAPWSSQQVRACCGVWGHSGSSCPADSPIEHGPQPSACHVPASGTALCEVMTHPMDSTPVLSLAAQSNLTLQSVPYRAVPSHGGSEERHGKRLHLNGCAIETFLLKLATWGAGGGAGVAFPMKKGRNEISKPLQIWQFWMKALDITFKCWNSQTLRAPKWFKTPHLKALAGVIFRAPKSLFF